MPKKRIRVVAAEIERDGHYLITQRRPEGVLPLLWEFPGGRVECGESDPEALARELGENLHANVKIVEEVLSVEREYDAYIIDFHVYRCDLLDCQAQPRKVHDLRWVTVAELEQYEFPAADQCTVDLLLKGK